MDGKVYNMNPEDVKFDSALVEFNPLKSHDEYESLKSLIETNGQLREVVMRRGLCVDGRHRVRIAKELGVQVKCVDIPDNTSDKDCLIMANLDTFGARNDTPTQKAFKVVVMVEMYGYNQTEAMKIVGTKNSRDVTAATFIRSNTEYREKYYEQLTKGASVTIWYENELKYAGKSLRRIKQELAAIEEMGTITEAPEVVEATVDYDELMHTETAKKEFWKHIGTHNEVSKSTKEWVISLLNTVYKQSPANTALSTD